MSVCQLCDSSAPADAWGECPVHLVPLAQGSGHALRYAFQPWAQLDEECQWSDAWEDPWETYSATGRSIDSVVDWQVPVPVTGPFSVLDDSEGISTLFFWTWSIRRALWRDLITQGFLRARLHHYPDAREGQGPTLWLSHTDDPPETAIAEWSSTEASMVLYGGDWPMSDRLAEFNSLFDLDSLPLRTVFYEEFDREELEYSFEVEFEVESGADPDPLPNWANLKPHEQISCVQDLLKVRAAADMLWVEDIIACVAFHPETTSKTLTESGMLETNIGREAVLRARHVSEEVRALAALSRA